MAVTSTPPPSRTATPMAAVDQAIADLQAGAIRLARSSCQERMEWVAECIGAVESVATDWVEAACRAKRIPDGSAARAEEVLVGPVAVVRYLQLIIQTLRDLQATHRPRLPGRPRIAHGQIRVPTFPTRRLFDAVTFRPMKAETWLQPGVELSQLFSDAPDRLMRRTKAAPRVCLVLGAGNVSAIPATDVLTYLLQHDHAVLLKMNPVNDYLGPYFETALAAFVRQGMLRIVYGGADVGRYAIDHPQIDAVHITGSTETHDTIVWGATAAEQAERRRNGQPLVAKPITSELGNVTPWAIIPGDYRETQLQAQAENIAASIANNASFNCIATKVLITWKGWHARERFLDLVEMTLRSIPPRYAYYPGAAGRFAEYAGKPAPFDDEGRLPWILRRGVDPEREPHLFQRESFVCVAAETSLEAASPEDFLEKATHFMNERLWGSLAAALSVPDALQKQNPGAIEAALSRLRYGTIGINQWPGVAYALMSPPWGAYPGAGLEDVQSGRGAVHNTYLLNRPEKTILSAPLSLFPKPMWFSTHRRPESLAWRLFIMYCKPSVWQLPGILGAALRG